MVRINSIFYNRLKRISRGKFSIQKIYKVKRIATNTVNKDNKIFSLQLQSLLNLYNQSTNKVNKLKEQIISLINDIQPKSMTIPSICPLPAATIYVEYGDIKKFNSLSTMLFFAGLKPSYYQTGISSCCMFPCYKKLIQIIYHLEKNIDFDSSKLR